MAAKKKDDATASKHDAPVIASKKSPVRATTAAASSGSKFKGKGSRRSKNRLILVTGFPKTRKTTAVSSLPLGKTKWLASDSNCAATLTALRRMPHPDDFHEVSSLGEAVQLTNEMLDAAEAGEDLGFEFLVCDSLTQFSNWHQSDIAKDTAQSYLGEQAGQGWQQFNADFGKFLDNLAQLTQYVMVVAIGHTKAGFEKKKGGNASLSLPPQMAERAAQLANWILYKTLEELVEVPEDTVADEYISVVNVRGEKHYFESILHTVPSGPIIATTNCSHVPECECGICTNGEKDGEVQLTLRAQEVGDLMVLLKRDGLVE